MHTNSRIVVKHGVNLPASWAEALCCQVSLAAFIMSSLSYLYFSSLTGKYLRIYILALPVGMDIAFQGGGGGDQNPPRTFPSPPTHPPLSSGSNYVDWLE